MAHFRALKTMLRAWLKREAWTRAEALPPEAAALSRLSVINALFACLPEGGLMTERAAFALGQSMAALYAEDPEAAKNIVRRFIWQMNEESGNIGWGVPEAFGETLAQCRPLAEAYHNILFSYVRDLPGDSTYCDHAPLRRSCYLAMARVLEAWPDLADRARPILEAAQNDPDEQGRGLAQSLLARLPL